jgi:hypothetical protein
LSECDGRCASGKTALATELATAVAIWNPAIQILRPSVDRFHNARERRNRQGEYSPSGYYEAAYDYQALADYLLSKRVRINWTFRPEKYMMAVMADGSELAAKYALLNPYLSERQRRLVAAAEARFLGRGESRRWRGPLG